MWGIMILTYPDYHSSVVVIISMCCPHPSGPAPPHAAAIGVAQLRKALAVPRHQLLREVSGLRCAQPTAINRKQAPGSRDLR